MRRNSPAFLIGAGLWLGACSAGDRATAPTGPNEQPSAPSLATSTTTGPVCGNYPSKTSTAIQQILTELGYIYPRLSPPLVALQVISNLLAAALAKAQQTQAQQFAVQIITRIESDLKAGKLQNPPQPNIGNFTTAAQVVDDLVKRLQCLTALPVTGNDPNSGVGVVSPNTSSTIITGNQTSGAFFPSGSVNTTTVITVQRLPNGPVLLTSLDQFPAFFEISSSNANTQITQQNAVIVGICNVADNTGLPNLLIAHNVGPNFGDVEVLPPVNASFLDCTQQLSSAAGQPRNFAAASWRAVSTGLGSFAKTLFLPAELHATIMAGGGPGGYTGKFSPFGTVEIASNPATLAIVDAQGNPASGVVAGPGLVYVKATSSGAHFHGSYLSGAYTSPNPIPNVPVNFGGTIVNTGANGIAQFNWTGATTPSATLTATAPNEAGCPTAPTTPVSVAYRPLVCFTPNSVTFISPDLTPPSFGSSWTYRQVADAGSEPSGWQTLTLPASSPWQTGSAAFGYQTYCELAVANTWTTGTHMLLRRDVYVPSNVTSATIAVLIDNDVQIWVNGFDASGGLKQHEGCANSSPPGPFLVGASTAAPTAQIPLQAGAVNKIAVLGVDRGDQTYLDVQMTFHTP